MPHTRAWPRLVAALAAPLHSIIDSVSCLLEMLDELELGFCEV
jgi:hypothetical protein